VPTVGRNRISDINKKKPVPISLGELHIVLLDELQDLFGMNRSKMIQKLIEDGYNLYIKNIINK
jgi:hypothetical protein